MPAPETPTQVCLVCGTKLALWSIDRTGTTEVRIYQCPQRHESWSYQQATGEWKLLSRA